MALSFSKPIPAHIAIVMDGNRRWARRQQLPSVEGHRQGVKAARRAVEACLQQGISTLTLYTFSSENWKRPQEEVSALMDLLAIHLRSEMKKLVREGVRFRALGRLERLPLRIQQQIKILEEKTYNNNRLHFNLAINYGGRQELVDAARQLMLSAMTNSVQPEELDESLFAEHLTTHGLQDPDLMIRTGGEQRISNFLLWQMAQTELIFLPIFWPEFDASHLQQAIIEFTQRRLGNDSDEQEEEHRPNLRTALSCGQTPVAAG
ncbi:MAG: di-trans,poly-cis-decaprenylcistransferase [Magnetococcales bacterium]|nr:di-trans,poly-cis-decaprenylcistransferase [Magnetococcales bacterium]